jgi:hypothetical protein
MLQTPAMAKDGREPPTKDEKRRGERVRQLREDTLGWTRKVMVELARAAGQRLTDNHLWKIETAENVVSTELAQNRVAAGFALDRDEFKAFFEERMTPEETAEIIRSRVEQREVGGEVMWVRRGGGAQPSGEAASDPLRRWFRAAGDAFKTGSYEFEDTDAVRDALRADPGAIAQAEPTERAAKRLLDAAAALRADGIRVTTTALLLRAIHDESDAD